MFHSSKIIVFHLSQTTNTDNNILTIYIIVLYILVIAGWEPLGSHEGNPSLSVDYSVTAIKNNCQDIDTVRVKVIKSTSVHSDHVQTKFIYKINIFPDPIDRFNRFFD